MAAVELPSEPCEDVAEVRGHASAKRALEVAAAGGHNLLMVGPPGSGKTMLARRLPGVLPALTADESLEVTRIHSVAGLLGERSGLVATRPLPQPSSSCLSRRPDRRGERAPPSGEASLAQHSRLLHHTSVILSAFALRTFEETAEEPAFLGRGLRFLHALLRLNNYGSLGFDRRRGLLLPCGMVEGLVLLQFGPRRETQVAVWTLQYVGHPGAPFAWRV